MGKASRSYVLTIPADVENDGYSQAEVQERLKNYTYVGQLEEGEEVNETTGKHYLHWQVYIENYDPIIFDVLRRKFDKKAAHIEKRQGTKRQAYEYCTKEDKTYQGIRIQNGDIELEDNQGKRTDLQNIADEVLAGASEEEVLIKYPQSAHCMAYIRKLRETYIKKTYGEKLRDNLHVTYIYGESGAGKTRAIYDTYKFSEVYRVTDYEHPFDNYNYEPVMVFDEFNSQIKIELMLTLLDIYPVQLPCRYNNKWACYSQVYIISNKPLDRQYNDPWKPILYEQDKAFRRRINQVIKYYFDDSGQPRCELEFARARSPTKPILFTEISNDDELPF